MIHVIVADNRTIRVFEVRPQCRLEEVVVFRNEALGKHERDLKSDRPGRVVGASGIHHAYDPSTRPSDHAKQRWFKATGPSLQSFLAGRRCDALMLVAAPRVLSLLRACLPAPLRRRVEAEVPRDLGRYPSSQLNRRLLPSVRAMLRKSARASSLEGKSRRSGTTAPSAG